MSHAVIDGCAGPGGWDLAAAALGIEPLGIECDDAACATREAVGLRTLQGDVAALDPERVLVEHFDGTTKMWGLIFSPPCQAWSTAGKGGGRRDKEHVVRCADELAAGVDTRAQHAEQCEDARSILVVEPLRWALALEPEWLAFEQVPPVLELWTMFAQILALRGYSTWAGVLEAERYGVPQTRERAVLIARRTGAAHPPKPTHQRYVPGEPARLDHTMEGEILPWVGMAQALGWNEGPAPAPAPTVTGGGGATGGVEVFGSKAARARATASVARLQGHQTVGGSVPKRYATRDADQPALTVDSRADLNRWLINGNQERAAVRASGEPAPTMTFGHNAARVQWLERPATTVSGDPRIAARGHHDRQMKDATRVTVEEAAALQTFPAGYPWQGSRAKQYEQVGNAVPPLLAFHILQAVTGLEAVGEVADAA